MKKQSIDFGIFFTVFSLIVFWMIMISSVSVYPSFKVTSTMVQLGKLAEPSNSFYLVRNMTHVAIGFFLFVLVSKVPYTYFERYARNIFVVALSLLAFVLFAGVTYNGAKGWIDLPLVPFSLQPVEFMKIAIVIYLAYFLKHRRSKIPTFSEWFLPFMLIVGSVVFLLALQPDFWSVLLIAPIAVILFFIGGGNVRYLSIAAAIFSVFAITVYRVWEHTSSERNSLSYISDRIDNFLADNQTSISNKTINFQTEQGLIAIGSGGFFGLWFGKSIQKFGYLPEVEGDFIFSVIAEELGFVGILVLISCYLFIGYRGFLVSYAVDDPFAKYVAAWITSMILIQAFVNVGVNLNIVPLTGVTLPFVSYGGSSLISMLIAVAILLSISRHVDYHKMKKGSFFFRDTSRKISSVV